MPADGGAKVDILAAGKFLRSAMEVPVVHLVGEEEVGGRGTERHGEMVVVSGGGGVVVSGGGGGVVMEAEWW